MLSRVATTPKDRLIVGLDLPSLAEAERLVSTLGDTVSFYKIGYRLAYAGGLDLARRLVGEGKQVFLDLKLHDIGNTVKQGVESLTSIGATFLTVHAYPQTMRAAVEGRGISPLKLLAVTVLTSYDDADLKDAGYDIAVGDLVAKRAMQAHELGIDGLIVAPGEVARVRPLVGPDMELITPGIRPAGAAKGDQKRVMTPGEAIRAGADRLVVARPVVAAEDPKASAAAIIEEIGTALQG